MSGKNKDLMSTSCSASTYDKTLQISLVRDALYMSQYKAQLKKLARAS